MSPGAGFSDSGALSDGVCSQPSGPWRERSKTVRAAPGSARTHARALAKNGKCSVHTWDPSPREAAARVSPAYNNDSPTLTSEKEFKKFNPITCYSLFGTLRPAADSGVCGALADRCVGSRQPTTALLTCTQLKLELWENSISSVLTGGIAMTRPTLGKKLGYL